MPELQAAEVSDIPLIRDLAQRIWWAHYPGIIPEAQIEYMLGLMYSPENLERQMTGEGQQFWLVIEDQTALGFLAVSRKAAGSYFLHKFYLDPAHQGQGLGTTVFRALLAQYPDAREIRLTVNRQNFKSINFYFKTGFVIEQCVQIPIGEGFMMDDFQMLWRNRGG